MAHATCPDRQTWERLIQGEYPPEESRGLEAHLSACDRCSSLLSDTLFGLQADTQLSRPAVAPAGEFEPIAAELKSLWNKASTPTQPALGHAEYAAQFAPLQPGEEGLGRLGHYLVKSLLGKGGMGCVLRAQDTRLSREVAVKIMTPAMAGNARDKSRFLREAQAVAAIRNDHVVEIHHVDEDRGVPYFVMPLLRGETLETRLRREKPLPYAEVLRIGREIAEGLAAAHDGARKLIHRDIKPANIWLEAGQDRVKLLDFGLALDADVDLKLTEPGLLLGSVAYMSPEQASCAAELDERTDLFSLGSVLYEMCTGRMAFKREGMMNTLNAIAGEQLPAPAELVLDLPAGFSGLVMRLLAKKPADRPASAAMVAAELAELQRASQRDASTATVTADQSRQQPAKKTPNLPERHRRRAVAAGAAALQSRSAPPPRRRRPMIAAAAAALLGLAFLAVIIVNLGGKEQLEITADESIQVTVLENNQVLIKDAKKNTTLQLRPGTHEFEVLLKDAAGEELGRFTTTDFKIVRGGKPVLDVRQKAAEAGVHLPSRDREAAEFAHANQFVVDVICDQQNRRILYDDAVPKCNSFLLHTIQNYGQGVNEIELIRLLPGTQIRSLALHKPRLTEADWDRVGQLDHLQELVIGGTNITDADFVYLKRLKLLNLVLDGSAVTGSGFKDLAAMKTLAHLNLGGTQIDDAGLANLKPLTELEALYLRRSRITDAGLMHLKEMHRLNRLELSHNRISDHGITQLAGLKALTFLTLDNTAITDNSIGQLIQLANLQTLDVRNTQLTQEGIQRLQKALPRCKIESSFSSPDRRAAEWLLAQPRVFLQGHMDGRGIQLSSGQSVPAQGEFSLGSLNLPLELVHADGLACLEGLEHLGLVGVIGKGLDNDGLKVLCQRLKNCPRLQDLSLPESAVDDQGVQHLTLIPQLTRILLTGSRLTDEGLRQLAEMKQLQSVQVGDNDITDAGLAHLAKLPDLKNLNVGASRVSDAGLAQLQQLNKLEALGLYGTQISDAGLLQFLESLSQKSPLHNLHLEHTVVSDAALPGLLSIPNLRTLAIRFTQISGNGYDTLQKAFPNAEIPWIDLGEAVATPALKLGGAVTYQLSNGELREHDNLQTPLPREVFRLTRLRIAFPEASQPATNEQFSRVCQIFGGYPTVGDSFKKLSALEFTGQGFTDDAAMFLKPSIPAEVQRIWDKYPDTPRPMSWLEELSLSESRITDAGLEVLSQFPRLKRLNLSGTAIRGSGLKHLKNLPELTELNLACPQLTDVYLPSLVDAPKLERLSLANSAITDASVETLSRVKLLKQLDLTGTKLSTEAIERLKTELPDCKIISTR